MGRENSDIASRSHLSIILMTCIPLCAIFFFLYHYHDTKWLNTISPGIFGRSFQGIPIPLVISTDIPTSSAVPFANISTPLSLPIIKLLVAHDGPLSEISVESIQKFCGLINLKQGPITNVEDYKCVMWSRKTKQRQNDSLVLRVKKCLSRKSAHVLPLKLYHMTWDGPIKVLRLFIHVLTRYDVH